MSWSDAVCLLQFIRYLISSNIGEVACIFLTAAIGMPEALIPVQLLWVNLVTDGLPATALGFNKPDDDIMRRIPRGRGEKIIDGWMFFRYMFIGIYIGVATVGGFIWWYLYYVDGPQITFAQLTNFHSCHTNTALFAGVDCDIFHDPRPSTISLSILVTVEMLNTFNALSENQSLTVVKPWSNPFVLGAIILSFLLHDIILYVPFFANIFSVAPINVAEWVAVWQWSLPVVLLDEALKYITRYIDRTPLPLSHAGAARTNTAVLRVARANDGGEQEEDVVDAAVVVGAAPPINKPIHPARLSALAGPVKRARADVVAARAVCVPRAPPTTPGTASRAAPATSSLRQHSEDAVRTL